MKNRTWNGLVAAGVAFLTCFVAPTAWACTNYSGQYESVLDSGLHLNLKLTQKDCESIFMEFDHSDGTRFTKTMIFDGAYRVIFNEPTFKTTEAFSITPDEIQVAAKLENKVTGSKHTMRGTFTLDSEMNLVETKTFFELSGRPRLKVIEIHTRLKGADIKIASKTSW